VIVWTWLQDRRCSAQRAHTLRPGPQDAAANAEARVRSHSPEICSTMASMNKLFARLFGKVQEAPPTWQPLEKCIGRERCADFILSRDGNVNVYRHKATGKELRLDDDGHCYVFKNGNYEPTDFKATWEDIERKITASAGQSNRAPTLARQPELHAATPTNRHQMVILTGPSSTPPQVAAQAPPSPTSVQVANQDRLGDRRPLVLSGSPDLHRIFSDQNPGSPMTDSEQNRQFWQSLTLATKRNILAIAYLKHPSPAVRLGTIKLVRDVQTVGVSYEMVNLLGDADLGVSRAAAESVWERERSSNCEDAVKSLRDEIRGSTSRGTTDGLVMGREKAIRALDTLSDCAPDEPSRTAIAEIAKREVIIAERIQDLDTASVQFARTEQRKQFTYELYQAPNREQALAFLKRKVVTKQHYYVEVETPDGTFGRDLNGIYW